jgi:hypothetical protein
LKPNGLKLNEILKLVHGLAILIEGENSELVVNDESKFAAWSSARTLTVKVEQ